MQLCNVCSVQSHAPGPHIAQACAQNTASADAPLPMASAVPRVLPTLLPSVTFRHEEKVGILPAPEHYHPNRSPRWLSHSGHPWHRCSEMLLANQVVHGSPSALQDCFWKKKEPSPTGSWPSTVVKTNFPALWKMVGLMASCGERDKSHLDVTNSSCDILVTAWAGIRCWEHAFKHRAHLSNMHPGRGVN